MCENLTVGEFLVLPLDRFTAPDYAHFLDMSLEAGESLPPDEFAYVHEPGTCLIEDAHGRRFLACIRQGEIVGPARMRQIADISEAELADAIRDRATCESLTRANICLALTLSVLCLNLMRLALQAPGLSPLSTMVPALVAAAALLFAAWLRGPELVSDRLRSVRVRLLALRDHLAGFSGSHGMVLASGRRRFLS